MHACRKRVDLLTNVLHQGPGGGNCGGEGGDYRLGGGGDGGDWAGVRRRTTLIARRHNIYDTLVEKQSD